MAFKADYRNDYKLWDYIFGDPQKDMSIMIDRWQYLLPLSNKYPHNFKVAFQDPISKAWTPWKQFPGHGENLLRSEKKIGWKTVEMPGLEPAIDVHRSVLANEIVIESDYPEYKNNYDASKIIGALLEKKGFIPHYYYSGNKSIHIHVFLDFDCLKLVDVAVQDQLRVIFKDSKSRFFKKFMEWLRAKMISCWDTGAREFDSDLVRATHLIRCELSKNKRGFKTFLGYCYRDLTVIPYVCNEDNRIYPCLGVIRESVPHDINGLLEEFLSFMVDNNSKIRIDRKNRSLHSWVDVGPEKLRGCVKSILSDDFRQVGDGTSRAMFILINETRRLYGDNVARTMIHDWNARMNNPIKIESEIEYRFTTKMYNLPCNYIHSFLQSISFDVSKKCKGNI